MSYTFAKSTRKNKKYMVNYNGKIIHFGHIDYEHYRDSTPLKLYSHLDHNDPKRRELYRKRASKIKDKNNKYTYLNKNSPNFWAFHFLW
jgi:hypothetical protein